MPRYRTLTDEAILDATIGFVTHHGVDRLTFSSLSSQVGLSPSTLVQRFSTKQTLLARAAKHGLKDMESAMELARKQQGSPLKAIISALVKMAETVTTVQEFAHGQAFFQLALMDDEVYNGLRTSTDIIRKEIKTLLDGAIVIQKLKPCDTMELALTLQNTYEGAITTWVIYQEGTIEAWMQQRLNAVIEPYKI